MIRFGSQPCIIAAFTTITLFFDGVCMLFLQLQTNGHGNLLPVPEVHLPVPAVPTKAWRMEFALYLILAILISVGMSSILS